MTNTKGPTWGQMALFSIGVLTLIIWTVYREGMIEGWWQ